MRARRALLYMPGDDLRKIQKATTLGVDCVCMDMEDGVATSRKGEARQTTAEALRSLDFGRSERLARINAVGTGLEADDLAAVLPSHPDGIVVPKVERSEQLRWVSEQLTQAEQAHGWSLNGIVMLAVVETALGITNLKEIAASTPRLQALIFGAEDLAGDMGAVRTSEAWEVFYARSAMVLHAAAYGHQPIDMVFVDFRDTAGLAREAMQGAQLGFAGKQIIHPGQVEPAQAAFTPTDEAIQKAMRIVEAANQHQQAGTGAFALDGKMVDAPVVKAAQSVLSRARAAGKI